MINDSVRQTLEDSISEAVGQNFIINNTLTSGGGCINETMVLEGDSQKFFLKMNAPNKLRMFEAEMDGLREIQSTKTPRAPSPIASGLSSNRAFLVLEYLSMGHPGGKYGFREMGRLLAEMHRHTAESFGWHRDNTIGSTPQVNTRTGDWLTFLREHRLGFQIKLARKNGLAIKRGDTLVKALPDFFTTYTPTPSLLHGDLWGGNATFDDSANPVIFDPACYYGDREAELAFTEVFGGFSREFYDAYNESWPLDSGYSIRKNLYNLYHILNHYNLFGGYYGSQAESMIQTLLGSI